MVVTTPWGASQEDFAEYNSGYRILITTSAILSILGSLLVIIAFLVFRQLRRYFSRIVVYLAISDLWLCTSMLMGQSRAPHYTRCIVQSALGSFFGLSSILWTMIVADSLRRVLLAHDLGVESKHEKKLHILAWGLPSLSVLIGLGSGVYGPAGMTCWIRNTALGTVVRTITFYIPLWTGIAYSVWVYWYVTSMMKELLNRTAVENSENVDCNSAAPHDDMERQRKSLRCLLLLPLVLAICWTPSSLRRLIDIFVPDPKWSFLPLDYLCVFMGPLQGALNAVVYGLTPAVRDAMTGRIDHRAKMLKGMTSRLGHTFKPTRKKFSRRSDDPNKVRRDRLKHDSQREGTQTRGGFGYLSEDEFSDLGDSSEPPDVFSNSKVSERALGEVNQEIEQSAADFS